MNELLKKIDPKDMTEDNDLFYLGVALVTKVSENNKANGEKKQSSKTVEKKNGKSS